MMKSFMTVLFAWCLILAPAAHAQNVKELNVNDQVTSAEGPFYDFYLGKDLKGYVRSKECKNCKEITFKISPDVEAKLDGKIVPLERFIMSAHQPSVLHFNRKGKLVQIVWYSK